MLPIIIELVVVCDEGWVEKVFVSYSPQSIDVRVRVRVRVRLIVSIIVPYEQRQG